MGKSMIVSKYGHGVKEAINAIADTGSELVAHVSKNINLEDLTPNLDDIRLTPEQREMIKNAA